MLPDCARSVMTRPKPGPPFRCRSGGRLPSPPPIDGERGYPALSVANDAAVRTWAVFGLRCFGAICAAHRAEPASPTELHASLVMTTGIEAGLPIDERSTFSKSERLFAHVTLTWDNSAKVGGRHNVRTIMTQNGSVLREESKDVDFTTSPARFWYSFTGSRLMPGEGQVEIQIGDALSRAVRFFVVAP